jgi:hypothetical protein
VEKEHQGDWTKKTMANYGTEKAQTMEMLFGKKELAILDSVAWKKKKTNADKTWDIANANCPSVFKYGIVQGSKEIPTIDSRALRGLSTISVPIDVIVSYLSSSALLPPRHASLDAPLPLRCLPCLEVGLKSCLCLSPLVRSPDPRRINAPDPHPVNDEKLIVYTRARTRIPLPSYLAAAAAIVAQRSCHAPPHPLTPTRRNALFFMCNLRT